MPPAAERACENSDLRRLADPLAAVRRYTSGHRAAGKALRRTTAGATCLQASVSRNPSDLHCVCDGSQCQRVYARPPREHCLPSCVGVSTTLKDGRCVCWFTAKTHVCFSSCVLSCAHSCYYTLSVNIPLTTPRLSLYLFPLCLSISVPLLLTVTCSLSVSLSLCLSVFLFLSLSRCLSLSLPLFCSLSLFPSLVFSHPSLARHTLYHSPPLAHALVLALVLTLALSICACVCTTLSYTHTHCMVHDNSFSLSCALSFALMCCVSDSD